VFWFSSDDGKKVILDGWAKPGLLDVWDEEKQAELLQEECNVNEVPTGAEPEEGEYDDGDDLEYVSGKAETALDSNELVPVPLRNLPSTRSQRGCRNTLKWY